MTRPLDGIRVLDIATFIAAPFCGAIMAEFGAEVIKVEKPGVGDPLRKLGTLTETGDTLTWFSEARNKKSITLDLRMPKGAALLKRLAADADVVLENFRPGTLEKWGLGFEELQAVNRGLILLRISAYGQTGPNRDLPGFARIAHAFSGISHLVGTPDGPPLIPGSTTLADYMAGAYGVMGVLMALRVRDATGEGQSIDVGLYEPIFRLLDELVPAYDREGVVRGRTGAETFYAVPHSHYPTRDGKWVAVACTNDKMFERLCAVMGCPELAGEGRLATFPQRQAAREEVNELVENWTRSRTQADAVAECAAGQVPCGPIYSVAEIFEDPQYRARGDLETVDDPRIGPLTVPAVFPFLSKTPGRIDTLGPALGAHNTEIYRDRLGLSAQELDRLKAEGVV
ncbi:MAG: CoA transferase [SAR324 cluster bacterium]|nr:CoA transferase [SAR324 cluster bacterium]